MTRSTRRTSTSGGYRRRISKNEPRRASWIGRRCGSGMMFADVVRPPSSSHRARHLALGSATDLSMSLGRKSSGNSSSKSALQTIICHSLPSLQREPLHGGGCAPLQSVARIPGNWPGYAVRPRHRASICTSEETGRMLSSRSVRPLTTRGISLRSIPMSRSRRSSMPRRFLIIFRRCHWRNVVRSQRRNAPGLRLRCLAVRGDEK